MKEFKKLVQEAKNILITTHVGQDQDAITSMMVVEIALERYMGMKNYEIILYNNTSFENPLELKTIKEPIHLSQEQVADLSKYDLIILTDSHQIERCLPESTGLKADAKIIAIEHHQEIKDAIEKLTLNFNEQRSSAVEQAYVIFKEMLGEQFSQDKDVARLVQIGITTDTGRFLFKTVSPETYRVFAEVMEVNRVDQEALNSTLYEWNRDVDKALTALFSNIVKKDDYSYTYITNDDLKDIGITHEDKIQAKGWINDQFLRYVKGINWSFVVFENSTGKNSWQVSFRARGGTKKVSEIAEKLGGGGHLYAAGANVTAKNVEEVIEMVLANA